MAMIGREDLLCVIFFLICTFTSCVLCSGAYSIEYAPDYMKYLHTENAIDLSEIPLVIKNSFGFSTENDIVWNGLAQSNPFKRPKAQVLFSVEGASQLSSSTTSFAVRNDRGDIDTEVVSEHIKDVTSDLSVVFDFSQHNALIDMQSLHPSVFNHIPSTVSKVRAVFTSTKVLPFGTRSLNVSVKEDMTFLSQTYLTGAIVEAMLGQTELSRDAYPDFFHFRLDGLKGLINKYGGGSEQVKDAENILRTVIETTSKTMQEVYRGSVVIQMLTYDVTEEDYVKLRSVRSLQAAAQTKTIEDEINVSAGYHDNYAVTFNIILWGMIILAVTVFAVSYGIWNMDPGHDSIIYRMTSQRLKRD